MREVISLHIGQTGVQLGFALWKLYCLEHGIDLDGSIKQDSFKEQGLSSFFYENSKGKYVPYALLFDMDPNIYVETSGCNRIFEDNVFSSIEDASNMFPRGYFPCFNQRAMMDFEEAIRAITERCDSNQGLMVFRSTGGGTGSGFVSALFNSMESEISKKCTIDVGVYPSKISAVVEPYNAILSTHKMFDQVSCSFMLDNEAVHRIAQNSLDLFNMKLSDLNQLVAYAMSTITASIRFEGPLNVDLIEFQTNLVPFPRIHFPFIASSPSLGEISIKETHNVQAITKSCFSSKSRLLNINAENGEYVACCMLYRGDVVPKEVNAAINCVKETKKATFVEWSPSAFKIGINSHKPLIRSNGLSQSIALAMVANSSAIADFWDCIGSKFDLMYQKAAFLHWYFAEGMEKYDFLQARENIAVLQKDYEELKS